MNWQLLFLDDRKWNCEQTCEKENDNEGKLSNANSSRNLFCSYLVLPVPYFLLALVFVFVRLLPWCQDSGESLPGLWVWHWHVPVPLWAVPCCLPTPSRCRLDSSFQPHTHQPDLNQKANDLKSITKCPLTLPAWDGERKCLEFFTSDVCVSLPLFWCRLQD